MIIAGASAIFCNTVSLILYKKYRLFAQVVSQNGLDDVLLFEHASTISQVAVSEWTPHAMFSTLLMHFHKFVVERRTPTADFFNAMLIKTCSRKCRMPAHAQSFVRQPRGIPMRGGTHQYHTFAPFCDSPSHFVCAHFLF